MVATADRKDELSGSDIRQLKGFDNEVRRVMRDWKVPGIAVAIVKDDEVILSRGYGLRDVAAAAPVTSHTLMPIGSTTKTFTTAGVALLADEGLVNWDTPVREYLPTFTLWDQTATEHLTARDMASHRSGLPRHDIMWYGSTASRADLFARLRYLQPTADLRTRWQYQNLMFMSLGYLTEVLSGLAWEDFVQKRMFDPLGMVSSRATSTAARESPDLSIGYRRKQNRVEAMSLYEGFHAVAPAGSIVSSVADMSQWLRVHLNGGRFNGGQFLSEAQIRQMHAPQMVMDPGKHREMPHSSYGLGWFVQPYRGTNMIHHGGNIDGFSAMFALMPEERVGVVILTNLDGTPARDILKFAVFDRFLDGKPVPWNARFKADREEMQAAGKRGKEKMRSGRVPRTRPSHPLDGYTGTYRHPGYGDLSVSLQDGKLRALYNGNDMSLTHYHYDTFDLSLDRFGATFKTSFLTNVRGVVDQISVPFESTVDNIVFSRIPEEGMTDHAFLERLVGSYDLMGNSLSISFKDDHTLQIALPMQPVYELLPVKGTEFAVKGVSGVTVEFILPDTGQSSEIQITQSGATFTAKRR